MGDVQRPRRVSKADQRLVDLIEYSYNLNRLGKSRTIRKQLISALTVLGYTPKEAEREIERARIRVRGAARKAEKRVEAVARQWKLWGWTDPAEAIRLMRSREFGMYEDAPLTDIERGLIEKGGSLLIIAVYPALKWAILARLGDKQV